MIKKLMMAGLTLMLLSACGTDTSNENDNAMNETATTTNVQTSTTADTNANGDVDVTNPAVSMKEAIDTFLAKYPDAKIESIELDADFGNLRYEIDGFDSAKEYDVVIDASTKEMKVEEVEANHDRDEALDLSNIIEPGEAIEKASAKEEVNGFTPVGWSLEVDDGRTRYSIEFKKGLSEIDIKVDAKTGEIIEVDAD